MKTLSLLISNASERFLSLLMTFILVAWLDPATYGEYAFNMALGSMLVLISNAGIGGSSIFLERSQKRTIGILDYSCMALVTIFVASAIAIIAVQLSKNYISLALINPYLIFLFIPLSFFSLLYSTLNSNINASKNFTYLAKVIFAKSIFTTISFTVIFYITEAITTRIISEIIILVVLVIILKGRLQDVFTYSHFSIGKIYLYYRYGLQLSLSQFLTLFIFASDRLMLGVLSTSESVAVYSFASQILALQFITAAVNSRFTPEYFELVEDYCKDREYSILKNMLIINFLAYFGIASAIIITFKIIVTVLFDEMYLSGHSSVILLTISLFLWSIGSVLLRRSQAQGISNHSLYCSIAAALANLILNYFLIPKYGINGAALSSTLSTFLYLSFASVSFVRMQKEFIS